MSKRKTIGISPLDAVIPQTDSTSKPPTQAKQQQHAIVTKKEQVTLRIPAQLAERLRNAVYWTPGLTLAGIAEKALQQAITLLEKKNGKPFPQRAGEIKTGRPLG